MNSPLPHFGTIIDQICDSLRLVESVGDNKNPSAVLSERTKRTISSGQLVKGKTWDEYAQELTHLLVKTPMFLFDSDDEQRLVKAFHSYRQSYEQMNDALTRLPSSPDTIQRSVMRLVILDMAMRYAAVCLGTGATPERDLPLWATKDGASKFWKGKLETHFPSLPLVDSGKPDGDCAAKLKMHPSKMRRCLYENDFPGLTALKTICTSQQELSAALRHYAAFGLCRQLSERFGKSELECWMRKLSQAAVWFYDCLAPVVNRFSASERQRLLKRILIGGVGDEMVQGLFNKYLVNKIPLAWRSDLMEMADSRPMDAVISYMEFCNYMGTPPSESCWESEYDKFQTELEGLVQTGRMPNGDRPNAKLYFAQLLAKAQRSGDIAQQERVLEHIIAYDPRDPEPYQLLGQLLEERGRVGEACKEYELAAAQNPDFVLPLYSLADLKSRNGQHEEAWRELLKIPELGLGAGSRAFLGGIILLRAAKIREAIPLLEAAYKIGWEAGSSAALLAWAHQRLEAESPNSRRESKRWEKLAQHNGATIEQVVKQRRIQ